MYTYIYIYIYMYICVCIYIYIYIYIGPGVTGRAADLAGAKLQKVRYVDRWIGKVGKVGR